MSRGFSWNPLESPEVDKHADAIASELIGSSTALVTIFSTRPAILCLATRRRSSTDWRRVLSKLNPRLDRHPRRPGPPPRPRPARCLRTSWRRSSVSWPATIRSWRKPTPRALVVPALNISRFECVQDSAEPGKDEILIGAVATTTRVLADGTLSVVSRIIDPIDFGKFQEG